MKRKVARGRFNPCFEGKVWAGALGLFLGLCLGGCGIKPQDDPGRTAVVLDLRSLTQTPSGSLEAGLASGQTVEEIGQEVVLVKVTGPGLEEPIQFLFLGLALEQKQLIIVPTGPRRTFEAWRYSLPADPPEPNTFPAEFMVTITPPELRTVDLTGEEITLELMVGPAEDRAVVGTYNGDGLIQVNHNGLQPIPGKCRIEVSATFYDAEFPEFALGPVPVSIGLAPELLDGQYRISGVPRGRSFKLKIENSKVGWTGESESVLVSNGVSPNPINVLLSGDLAQTMCIYPTAVYVADGLTSESVTFQTFGGSGSFRFSSRLAQAGQAALDPATGVYSVVGTVQADTVDTVTVTDSNSVSVSATAQVFWYMVPSVLDSFSVWPPGIYPDMGDPLGGDSIAITGSGFGKNSQVFFGNVLAPTIKFVDYTTLSVYTPPGPMGNYVDVRVFNPCSNPLFPEFIGFDYVRASGFYYSGAMSSFEVVR